MWLGFNLLWNNLCSWLHLHILIHYLNVSNLWSWMCFHYTHECVSCYPWLGSWMCSTLICIGVNSPKIRTIDVLCCKILINKIHVSFLFMHISSSKCDPIKSFEVIFYNLIHPKSTLNLPKYYLFRFVHLRYEGM
jgi:hypothetical protein